VRYGNRLYFLGGDGTFMNNVWKILGRSIKSATKQFKEFVCSLVKSGLIVIMCRKAIVYDILTGSIPKPGSLDEFIRPIELYLNSAVHVNR